MTKFNQDKFESKAKELVAQYLNYEISEKDVFVVWFSKVGANAKAMLSSDLDHRYRYFDVTYFGEEGKYVVDDYDFESSGAVLGDKSNGSSTSHVQIEGDKIQTSIVDKIQISDETKCPVCQEYHPRLGITETFQLQVKEDILILTVRALYSDKRLWKDAFKIKYCPFCGRKL
ncbi:hypothetical protein HCY87_04660 [Limosilactobacillus fermentum]